MKSNIESEIENLIIRDLRLLKAEKGKYNDQTIWKYRDRYFLGGNYDYLFEQFIEDNKLVKYEET